MVKLGDKEAVYYGDAERTSGGLRKHDLMVNSKGKIISKKQHECGKKRIEHLKSAKNGGSFKSFLVRYGI